MDNKKPLTLWQKLSYGLGDFGAAITVNIVSFYLLFFLTNIAKLSPTRAGLVLLVGKLWDGTNDPIIGWLSDKTRSAVGRRLPWMIHSAVPLGISFFLLWLVPFKGENWLFSYYVVVALLFNTFYTAVNLPYAALTAELTDDYNERTVLTGFRFSFSIGGSILSLVVALVVFKLLCKSSSSCQESFPYTVLGGIIASLCVITTFGCIVGIKQRVKEQNRGETEIRSGQISLPKQIMSVLSNVPFLYVVGIYFCYWLALQITASIIPFYVTSWMRLDNADFTQVMLAVQGTALGMLFVWSRLSQHFGKRGVIFMGVPLWLIAQVGLYLLQPGQVVWMYLLAILAGCGLSTAYLIPWSMVPDVTDLDELNTGERREGIFYAFMVLLQKMGLAVGLFLLGLMLDATGFVRGQLVQPESALQAIRLAIAPIPATLLVLTLVLAYFYPLTQSVHHEIRLQLQERRKTQNLTDNSNIVL
ncbi:MAG: MFS transporter [Pseudanabaenaceae cyanobacterium SKYGB_i_bin29]|nr:MFS transporter [Pseudanabaenaceae cyanobacterium SKYG29]MDW8420534.1 MFS transporter [Pseudanabaenaceae cyanobacterium SKYGB_i_bin29]